MDAYDKRAADSDLPRRPENTPLKPAYQRPERRTRPTYKTLHSAASPSPRAFKITSEQVNH